MEVRTTAAALAIALSPPAASAVNGSVIRVPQDAGTVQAAIAAAEPGDTIVLDAGTYPGGYAVPRRKRDLTIRGVDRNRVVLDGAGTRRNGFVVHADGVAILNMSAHDFRSNAFYWEGADRFRASYLTAWNVGQYGIYVEDGQRGVVDHDYVSGAADAAYYVGECRPCRATIAHVVARLSAVGYSGTNATGVTIRDSLWDRNGTGILPNSFANEALPPQARTTIVRNRIVASGRAPVPIATPLAGLIGIGIAIAGGNENVVNGNQVRGSERYGIAVFPTARYVTFDPSLRRDPQPPWRPRGNRIVGNIVTGSGSADLALARGSGSDNCFAHNYVRTAHPPRLQSASCGASPAGDARVAFALTRRLRTIAAEVLRRRQPPPYTTMPAPPPQPSMPPR